MENTEKQTIDRRDFLKGAVGVGALATAGIALTAYSMNPTISQAVDDEGVIWDEEVDVLVVGSGTAAFGAITAKKLDPNARVLIIEKLSSWGGTSAVSGATMWVPRNYPMLDAGMNDSKEEALTYMKACAAGRGDEALFEAYLDNGPKFLEWARDNLDFGFGLPPARNIVDYYAPLPGYSQARGVRAIDSNGVTMVGPGTWEKIRAIADELAVEIMFETTAETLITGSSGIVLGLTASSGSKKINIKVNKGIILGTGGYDHNKSLMRETQPFPIYNTNACIGNTGDAQIMGAAIGAALSGMDGSWGWPAFLSKPFNPNFDPNMDIVFDSSVTDSFGWRGKPGSIVVNKYGKRFGNEGSLYPVFNRAFSTWDTDKLEWSNIPGYFICDSGYTEFFTLPKQLAVGDPLPDFIITADSLEELAAKLEIDVDGLMQEIDQFNADAANGVDPRFHRGEHPCELATSGDIEGLRGLPNCSIAPLVTPPFYGALYVPGIGGTNGGLKIDGNAQVQNVFGQAIIGLYAVGNCSASVSGGAYCSAGMTVGSGSVMAWAAAMHIMGA